MQQPPSPRAHAPPHKFQGPTTTPPLCTPQLSPQSGRHPQGQPRAWGVCFGRQTMPQPPKACSPTHQPGGRGPGSRAAAAAAGKDLGAWAPGSQAWPAPWQHAGRLWERAVWLAAHPPLPPTSTNAVDRGPAPPSLLSRLLPSPGCSTSRIVEEGSDPPQAPQGPGLQTVVGAPVGLTLSQCPPLSPSRRPTYPPTPSPPTSQVVLPQPPQRNVCSVGLFFSQMMRLLPSPQLSHPAGPPPSPPSLGLPPQPRPEHPVRSLPDLCRSEAPAPPPQLVPSQCSHLSKGPPDPAA